MILDANVLLRHLTGHPEDLADRATRFLLGADDLWCSDTTIAEVVWVLGSVYDAPRGTASAAVRAILAIHTIEVDAPDLITEAARLFETVPVSWVDAYLGAISLRSGDPVVSFDTDFDRLGIDRVIP